MKSLTKTSLCLNLMLLIASCFFSCLHTAFPAIATFSMIKEKFSTKKKKKDKQSTFLRDIIEQKNIVGLQNSIKGIDLNQEVSCPNWAVQYNTTNEPFRCDLVILVGKKSNPLLIASVHQTLIGLHLNPDYRPATDQDSILQLPQDGGLPAALLTWEDPEKQTLIEQIEKTKKPSHKEIEQHLNFLSILLANGADPFYTSRSIPTPPIKQSYAVQYAVSSYFYNRLYTPLKALASIGLPKEVAQLCLEHLHVPSVVNAFIHSECANEAICRGNIENPYDEVWNCKNPDEEFLDKRKLHLEKKFLKKPVVDAKSSKKEASVICLLL